MTTIVEAIAPALIDAGDRLRALDPAWVALLADEIVLDGQREPIRVVARGVRYLLIDGARRLAAVQQIGGSIEARIEPEAALQDVASLRLAEIKANLMRGELTVYDRSVYVAAWRDIYLSVHTLPKRGRGAARKNVSQVGKDLAAAANDDTADAFLMSLTEAAKRALALSKNALYRALTIAKIEPAQGRRLAGHPLADHQSELLMLAEQPAQRQVAILDLILGTETAIDTVADAIIRLDGIAAPQKLSPPERFHQAFARWRPQDREAFFELNAEAIERWMVARTSGRKPSRRGVA